MDIKKVVLVHPDKQHSFKTAKALQDAGVLYKYITTVYDKKSSLTHIFANLLKGHFSKKLKAHRSDEIFDEKVKQFVEPLSLFLFILVRLDKKRNLYSTVKKYRDARFNKKVVKYCKKNNVDAIISFDTLSAQFYSEIERQNYSVIKILDMSAPYFPYMCGVFSEEAAREGADSQLSTVMDTSLFDYWKKQSEQEILKADAFLVASNFTRKTLVESGADASKIFKCVYGIDTGFFNADGRIKKESGTLNCIYVGNITEQKGCRCLLETMQKTRGLDIRYTFVGAYDLNNPIVKECYEHEKCEFTGYILKNELRKKLLESDVMIFPSLADGFGFSVLEAMACGVVPICSANAGVSDLISHGENGFIVGAKDSDAVFERLSYLNENRDQLAKMSEKASESVKKVTWESYYKDIEHVVDTIVKQ